MRWSASCEGLVFVVSLFFFSCCTYCKNCNCDCDCNSLRLMMGQQRQLFLTIDNEKVTGHQWGCKFTCERRTVLVEKVVYPHRSSWLFWQNYKWKHLTSTWMTGRDKCNLHLDTFGKWWSKLSKPCMEKVNSWVYRGNIHLCKYDECFDILSIVKRFKCHFKACQYIFVDCFNIHLCSSHNVTPIECYLIYFTALSSSL